MTVRELRPQIDRDFWLEGFRDFLALEAGQQRQHRGGLPAGPPAPRASSPPPGASATPIG